MSPEALLKSTQEILQEHGNELTISPSCYFNLSLNICKTPIKTKLLVIPTCEELRHDKTSRKKQKIIRAVILLVDYTYSEICFNQDELTYSKFKENVLINVASRICV